MLYDSSDGFGSNDGLIDHELDRMLWHLEQDKLQDVVVEIAESFDMEELQIARNVVFKGAKTKLHKDLCRLRCRVSGAGVDDIATDLEAARIADPWGLINRRSKERLIEDLCKLYQFWNGFIEKFPDKILRRHAFTPVSEWKLLQVQELDSVVESRDDPGDKASDSLYMIENGTDALDMNKNQVDEKEGMEETTNMGDRSIGLDQDAPVNDGVSEVMTVHIEQKVCVCISKECEHKDKYVNTTLNESVTPHIDQEDQVDENEMQENFLSEDEESCQGEDEVNPMSMEGNFILCERTGERKWLKEYEIFSEYDAKNGDAEMPIVHFDGDIEIEALMDYNDCVEMFCVNAPNLPSVAKEMSQEDGKQHDEQCIGPHGKHELRVLHEDRGGSPASQTAALPSRDTRSFSHPNHSVDQLPLNAPAHTNSVPSTPTTAYAKENAVIAVSEKATVSRQVTSTCVASTCEKKEEAVWIEDFQERTKASYIPDQASKVRDMATQTERPSIRERAVSRAKLERLADFVDNGFADLERRMRANENRHSRNEARMDTFENSNGENFKDIFDSQDKIISDIQKLGTAVKCIGERSNGDKTAQREREVRLVDNMATRAPLPPAPGPPAVPERPAASGGFGAFHNQRGSNEGRGADVDECESIWDLPKSDKMTAEPLPRREPRMQETGSLWVTRGKRGQRSSVVASNANLKPPVTPKPIQKPVVSDVTEKTSGATQAKPELGAAVQRSYGISPSRGWDQCECF